MNNNVKLTSGETAQLWTAYLNDTLTICVLKYFLATIQDSQIEPVLKYALDLSEKHIQRLTTIFTQDQFPLHKDFQMPMLT